MILKSIWAFKKFVYIKITKMFCNKYSITKKNYYYNFKHFAFDELLLNFNSQNTLILRG
jgi:hypothetical protein